MKSGNDFSDRGEKKKGRGTLGAWLALVGILGSVFVAGAILYVWLYVQQVQNGYRLARYYEEHEQLLIVQRKLKLEWSRFQDPFQLEEMGRNQFGLGPPKPDQKFLMR